MGLPDQFAFDRFKIDGKNLLHHIRDGKTFCDERRKTSRFRLPLGRRFGEHILHGCHKAAEIVRWYKPVPIGRKNISNVADIGGNDRNLSAGGFENDIG